MDIINSRALPRRGRPRRRNGISWPECVVIIIVITSAAVLAVLGISPTSTALTLSAGSAAAVHLLIRLKGATVRSQR
ncbi:hypothetical protein G9272_43460 [Streptomyces asoensis]|uniref:Uncharacterized protein n=1 Tax=Streptomyces asoensis TaxID=249586 RepID=A0A6M4X0J6_9ACTN|nr:hypothetical protein [Streptomyces asoensis]QJT06330.1 hypothetical protein G9272_43460 [Streptomyces asoensis]